MVVLALSVELSVQLSRPFTTSAVAGAEDCVRSGRAMCPFGMSKKKMRGQRRVIALEARAARVDELEAENLRLAELLEFAETRKDLRLGTARVVSRSNSPLFRVMSLTIDAGRSTSCLSGNLCFHPGCHRTGPLDFDTTAEVLLLTDPEARSTHLSKVKRGSRHRNR